METIKILEKILKPLKAQIDPEMIELVSALKNNLSKFISEHSIETAKGRNYKKNKHGLYCEGGLLLDKDIGIFVNGERIILAHELLNEDIFWSMIDIDVFNNKNFFDFQETEQKNSEINESIFNELLCNNYIDNEGYVKYNFFKSCKSKDFYMKSIDYEYNNGIWLELKKQMNKIKYFADELNISYEQAVVVIRYIKNNQAFLSDIVDKVMKSLSRYKGDINNYKAKVKTSSGKYLLIGNLIHSNLLNLISSLTEDDIFVFFGHHHKVFMSRENFIYDNSAKIRLISPGAGGAKKKIRSSGFIIVYEDGMIELKKRTAH